MQVSRIVPFVLLMAMVLKQSTEVNAVDTLYIVSGIYNTDGNAIKTPFVSDSLPSNIVLGPNGNLFVTDGSGGQSANKVLEYDLNGNLVKTLITNLDRPRGIAFDSNGHLFVGANGTIMEFDINGNLINSQLPGIQAVVESIVIDSSGFLYYSNNNQSTIGRYDLNNVAPLNPDFITGISGAFGMALDGKGYLYTTNYRSDKVGKYDLLGNTVNASLISGNVNGLNSPYRMAIDSSGDLYVTNNNYSQVTGPDGIPGVGWVSKYDSNGNMINTRLVSNIWSPLWGIAIVPEPSSYILSIIAAMVVVLSSRLKFYFRSGNQPRAVGSSTYQKGLMPISISRGG